MSLQVPGYVPGCASCPFHTLSGANLLLWLTPCLLLPAPPAPGGLPVDNPKDFAARIYSLMGASSGSSSSSSAASSSSGGGSEVKQVDAEVV